MDRTYSGLAMITPSLLAITSMKSRTASGRDSPSRSGENTGNRPTPSKIETSISLGAMARIARSIAVLVELSRALPDIARILMILAGID